VNSEIVIRKYQETDAAELLRMWKESQHGWPMGLSMASGNSPDQFNTNLLQGNEFAHYIAVDTAQKRVVGYCGFSGNPADERFSNLPLLNVHPEWQKHGIGRRLIAAVVDEATAGGFRRVDLGTWPGNMYAVGLYKRCGFCWVPETDIYMMNYMPLIRTTPYLQPFFQTHDWYGSYQADKTVFPDDHTIGQMKIFIYRFKGGDESLTVTIDRNASAVAGIETSQLQLELLTDDSDALRGFSHRMTCRIRNCHSKPLKGTVNFTGCHGLNADIQQPFSVKAGAEWEQVIDVDIPCDMENPHHGPRPSVAADVSFDDQTVRLETGLKSYLPLECQFNDADVFLPAGRAVQRVLNIENRLNRSVSVNVSLKPESGLAVEPETTQVSLPARSLEGISMKLTAESGRKKLDIAVTDTDEPHRKLPAQQREICGRAMNETGWIDSREKIVARNAFVTVIANRVSGRIIIMNKHNRSALSVALPDTGPPFPFHSTEQNPVVSCHRRNGHLCLTVSSASTAFQGVTRVMDLYLGDGPLIRLSGRVTTETGVLIPQIHHSVYGANEHSETVIPTRDGIISHSDASFPFGKADLPDDPALYPESWFMLRFSGGIAGVVWEGKPEKITWADWKYLTLKYHDVTIGPNKPWTVPDLHLYMGPGDEKTVQNLWADVSLKEPQLKVQPLIGFDREIEPLIVRGRETLTLTLKNRREFTESGTLILKPCPKAGLRRRSIAVKDLNCSKPKTFMVTLNPRYNYPVVTNLSGVFRTDTFEVPVTIPMILFPKAERIVHIDTVKRNDHDTFRIDNGRMLIDVTPSFNGAVTSLTYDGIPVLRSPYPETGILGFESPWYGGVTPEVRLKPQEETELKWTGCRVTLHDDRGLEWSGVRLNSVAETINPGQQASVTLDYLTLPGCPVLMVRMSIQNTGTAIIHPVSVQCVFPGRNGNPPEKATYSRHGKTHVRYLSDTRGVFTFDNWTGFASSETGSGLAVVHNTPIQHVTPLLIDVGKDGFYVCLYSHRKLEPDDTLESTQIIVPFDGDATKACAFGQSQSSTWCASRRITTFSKNVQAS
jgi:ribosomal protein S18 acetylase RimI-like enzyme